MKKIFFSYTLKDLEINKEFLNQIKSWLNSQNIDSFIDFIDNSYDANNFQEKLISELINSDIVFVINTSQFLDSQWTKIELEEARKRKIKIIKVNIEDIELALNEGKTFEAFIQKYI